MRRIQKILIGTFLGGVLLTGVGTGMALVEYSSLAYAGVKQIGEEKLVTRELDFKLEEDIEKVRLVRNDWNMENWEACIEEDKAVPAGIIRYVVTYNPETVDVFLAFDKDDESRGHGYLSLQREYCDDGFAIFMESKDQVLGELKERKISSYHVAYVTGVVIKANPETIPRLEYDLY